MTEPGKIAIDDTALDPIAVSAHVTATPKPDRASFTAQAKGFRDAAGNWHVREPVSGEVFDATLSGTKLFKNAPIARAGIQDQLDAMANEIASLRAAVKCFLGCDAREAFPTG